MSETEVTTENQEVDIDNLDTFSSEFFGQNKEKPAETKVEVEQEEEPAEVKETEAQTDEEDEAELQEEVKDPPKKKATVQDRINELVAQREEARREAAAEIAKVRQEFEDFKKSQTPATEQVAEAAEPAPDAVDKDGNPIYALGEFDPQYIRDLTRFTLNQERAKVEAETAESQRQNAANEQQQALQTGWNAKVTEATTEHPDFVEKGQALLNGFNDLPPAYAGYLTNILMSMDKGPDVLYYLSNHPEEAREIVNSGAQKATLALGRIESQFIKGEQEAPKPKISKAPAPPQERARGTNGAFISVAPDTDDLDSFSAEFFRKK